MGTLSAASDELEAYSALVGEVYDAALDATLWPSVLERATAFVQGSAASLMLHDLARPVASLEFSWGDDPAYSRRYTERYAQLNPLIGSLQSAAQTGSVFSSSELMPWQDFSSTRFYQEWAKPQGYVDVVHAVLERTPSSFASLAVARHEREGLVDDGTRQRMRLILPHFRRAVLVGRTLHMHRCECATLADTLNEFAVAVFLVDGDRTMRHSNLSGSEMLEAGVVLCAVNDKLCPMDIAARSRWNRAIQSASVGEKNLGTRGISLAFEGTDGETYVAHVLPLTSGARRKIGNAYDAVVAVFVHTIELDLRPPPELGEHFDLTSAELRVLMAVVAHGSTRSAAEALGIGQTTLKTHLSRVFSKTRVGRQAELVKLVAGFACSSLRTGRKTLA
jgi:DNA-binding CsgD family transcriptional regulator